MLLLLVLLMITQACSAWADAFSYQPHADFKLLSLGYPDSVDPVVNSWLETMYFDTSTTGGWGRQVRFSLKTELQADPMNNSIQERYWAEVPEGYLQFRPLQHGSSLLSFQAGINTFTWGVTDGYNPLDVVSAARYKDPLNSEKLGAPALSTHVEVPGGAVSLDGIYIPYQRRSILPGENSRWLPRETLSTESSGSVTVNIPNNPTYYFNDSQELDRALWNDWGARLQAHLSSLDLSAVYFNGASPVPAVGLSVTGNTIQVLPTTVIAANPDIGIDPIYYRQEVYGGTAVYTLGAFIFRTEAAFTRVLSRNPALPGNSEIWVGEAEHEFDFSDQTLTAILEGTVGQHQDPQNSQLYNLGRMFDRSVIAGFRYVPSETVTVSSYGLFDVDYHGQLGHLEIADSLTDNLKTTLSGEILSGPFSTPIGTYRKNSRVFMVLDYSL